MNSGWQLINTYYVYIQWCLLVSLENKGDYITSSSSSSVRWEKQIDCLNKKRYTEIQEWKSDKK